MIKLRLFLKNNIISYFFKIISPDKNYLLNLNKKGYINLSCDFISLKERLILETESIKIADKLVKINKQSNFNEYLSLSIKKRTSIEINKVLTYNYISNYLKNKNFKERNCKVIIFDTDLSIFLYYKLKKKINIDFKINIVSSFLSICKEFIKILILLSNIIIISHVKLLTSLFIFKKIKKKQIQNLYYLDNSQKNYFFSDLNPENISNKVNYVFDDETNINKNIQKKSIFLRHLKNKINFVNYFNKIYLNSMNLKFLIMRVIFNYGYSSMTLLKNIITYEKWRQFSLLYNSKNIIVSMVDHNPFYYAANKKNNSKLLFIYFSYHSGLKILPRKKMMLLDYSFMKYDVLIAPKKDITIFNHKFNKIETYSPNNVFDLYLKQKKNNQNLKSKLKKVVFFDASYGFKKSQNYFAYSIFLDTIIDISKTLNLEIFIKSKLSFRDNLSRSNEKIKSKLKIIKSAKNINYVDNNSISSQIIKKCDLSISLFTTTTFYESIYLGTPSIFFDPSKRYKNFLQSISNIKYQKAYTKKELIKNIIILNNLKIRKKLRNESKKFLYRQILPNSKLNIRKLFN